MCVCGGGGGGWGVIRRGGLTEGKEKAESVWEWGRGEGDDAKNRVMR